MLLEATSPRVVEMPSAVRVSGDPCQSTQQIHSTGPKARFRRPNRVMSTSDRAGARGKVRGRWTTNDSIGKPEGENALMNH
jgi:hypothetical protein